MTTKPTRSSDLLPLRVRLMFLISVGVLLFGGANLVIVGRLSYRALAREQEHRLRFVADLLAKRAEQPLLQDDRVEIDKLVHQSAAIDPDLAYVLVTDPSGSIVAHTFEGKLPPWVLAPELRSSSRRPLLSFETLAAGRVRELAVPVLGGRLGTVRVGVKEADVRRPMVRLLSVVAGMVLMFLVIGLVSARWVARRVTAPLEKIVSELEELQLAGPPFRPGIKTGDEMELLAVQVQDVTDRLQLLYRQERKRERELARMERLAALGTLTAGLGHELNNPLAGIKNAAQRLQQRADDAERVDRYADLIGDAVRRMEQLLGDMLTFSRTSALDIGRVEVCPAVRSAVALAAPRFKEAGADCTIDCPDGCPTASSDAGLLVQAMLNLLINAADAVAGGSRREVIVSSRSEAGSVTIEVADSGPGVDAGMAERIFNPFFTTKPPGRGTGLGLSAAWNAVHEMGGTLVLSNPGERGARFTIILEEWQER
ncbi:MAG: HAMP domain-containing protein [Acidobacteria bacterium]|nr:HAMP domain-containing protein [Acidobacteriota bacterium]